MPTLTLHDDGAQALFDGDFDPTHMQLGSDALTSGLDTLTNIGTVVQTLLISYMLTGNEIQFASIDTDDAEAYDDFRTLAVWAGDPSNASSILLGVGSTGDTAIYGEKQLGRDLLVSGSFLLTTAQAANVSFTQGLIIGNFRTGSRNPVAADGANGDIWSRTDASYVAHKSGGMWRRLRTVLQYELLTDWGLAVANANPEGISSDGTNIYVVDPNTDRVYVYSASGAALSDWALATANANPFGISSDGTNIYVVDATSDHVYVYSASGAALSDWALAVANDRASGISSDGTNIYVVDGTSDRVYVYSSSGAAITDWALAVANDRPEGISSDGTNIYVVDGTDLHVYVYSASGAALSNWALATANANPFGISSDGTNIYVVDRADDRVYVYSL